MRGTATPTAPLHVSLFGPFRVLRHGRDVTPIGSVRTGLLAAMILSRGQALPVAELAAAIWPHRVPLDPEAAVRMEASVRMEAAAVNARLKARTPPRAVVERGPDGWLIDLPDPCTDVEDVEVLARAADRYAMQGRHEAAVGPLLDAWAIFGHRPLDGFEAPWFEAHRRRLDDRATRAGQVLAGALVDGSLARTTAGSVDPEYALCLLEGLVARFPRSLELRERLITGLHLAGDDQQSLAVQEIARNQFAASWRGRAATATDDLHAQLTRPTAGPAVPPPAPAAAPAPVQVRLSVLGPHLVAVDGHWLRMPEVSYQRVLTALLLRHGTAVADDDLAVAADLPSTADAPVTVDALLSDLRSVLDGPGGPAAAALGAALDIRSATSGSTPPGRVATVRPGVLDLEVAQTRATRGAIALANGRAAAAVTDLRGVLEQVPPRLLPGLGGPWFAAERARLDAWRDRVARTCVDAEIAAGHREAAVAALRDLARAHPLDEDLTVQLMTVLADLERVDDALDAYAALDRRLQEHLATAPGPTAQMLRRRLAGARTAQAPPGAAGPSSRRRRR